MPEKHSPPPLTAAIVEAAVRKAYPALQDSPSCFRIAEGGDHNVWCAGNEIILRCLPSTGRPDGTSEASLRRDAAVSKLLRRYVRRAQIVPKVYSTIKINGWIGNIESRIHGTSLEIARPTFRTEEDLADLLKDLASVPFEEAKNAVGYAEDRPNMKRRVSKAIRAWEDLIHCGYIHDSSTAVQDLLQSKLASLNDPNEQHAHPVLLHADISGEHILISEEDGTVQGIIDWSDALVGDVSRDIAGISLAVGRDMASRIGLKAGYSRTIVERGLLYAMCLTVSNLRDCVCGHDDSPEGLLRSQFERSFEGTGLERALC